MFNSNEFLGHFAFIQTIFTANLHLQSEDQGTTNIFSDNLKIGVSLTVSEKIGF